MDINKMSENELKALAFDLIRQQDAVRNDLSTVLEQLSKVQSKPKEEKVAKPTK